MAKYVSSIEEFLSLEYPLTWERFEEQGEKGFVVRSPEIPGLEVFGETKEEALKEVKEAKKALFHLYKKQNLAIKYPNSIRKKNERQCKK